ncbi:MAG: O-antigen ligase family protein [Parasphingorhabdus sp.]|uniref:O-antigen ligase family protein n=1 Tax=Parasphingorhabdus sp. TaxID=2709688 RepID=UPI003296B8C0
MSPKSKKSKRKLPQFLPLLREPISHFYVFIAFVGLVFLTGGSARDDVQSLIVLRPFTLLFGAYALVYRTSEHWKGRQFPLYIGGLLLLLMIAQLIPLPPSIWEGLSGRKIFSDIGILAGIDSPWRPLSLSPSRTLNSLFSLTVPLTAMMLYLNLHKADQKKTLIIFTFFAALSALLAALQIAGPTRGPLYFYNITNYGVGVGLFANRNHQSVFLAATIITLGWYAASQIPSLRLALLKFYAAIAGIIVLVPLIFITGSRAGLILMVPAIFVALALIYFGRYANTEYAPAKKRKNKKLPRLSMRQTIVTGSLVALATVIFFAVYLSRSLALDRLFDGNDLGELRTQLLPTLFQMLNDYFPWGSGFGSFEHVYRIYEPQELLRATYLNQAHNDWLQFPIEGGLPAILIAGLAMIWFVKRLISLVKNWSKSRDTKYVALTAIAIITCFLTSSIGDYPLRVPSLIMVFAVLACLFGDAVNSVQHSDRKRVG